MAVTGLLGVVGVAWGIQSGSQMILFDGVYGLIGIAVSFLLLRASARAEGGPTPKFPYGREAMTPLAIGVQGVVILATLLYAIVEAVYVIRDGGSDVTAGSAIIYSCVVTAASFAFWFWVRARSAASELIASEAMAWRLGAFRGVGMVIGFVLLAAVTGSRWDGASRYIDPVMVLVTCAAFVGAPLRTVRDTILELLESAPRRDVQAPVLAAVGEVFADGGLATPDVRMSKVGPKLYVEVDGTAASDATLAFEHELRRAVQRRLDDLPYEVWLNLELRPEA